MSKQVTLWASFMLLLIQIGFLVIRLTNAYGLGQVSWIGPLNIFALLLMFSLISSLVSKDRSLLIPTQAERRMLVVLAVVIIPAFIASCVFRCTPLTLSLCSLILAACFWDTTVISQRIDQTQQGLG